MQRQLEPSLLDYQWTTRKVPVCERAAAINAARLQRTSPILDRRMRLVESFEQNDRFAGKVGFSPDLESSRMWAASLEKANNPPRHLRHPKLLVTVAGAGLSSCSPRWGKAHAHTLSSFRRIKLYESPRGKNVSNSCPCNIAPGFPITISGTGAVQGPPDLI